jgi:hypothetical protein
MPGATILGPGGGARTNGRCLQSASQPVRRLLRTAGRERLDTQSPIQPHTVPVTYVVMGSGVLQSDDEFCVGWCDVALLLHSPRPLSS